MTNDRLISVRRWPSGLVLAVALLSAPRCASAQASIDTASRRPLLLLGVRYASTTRTTGEAGVFIPVASVKESGKRDVLAGYWGLNVEAGVADGGRRLAIGAAHRVWDPDFRIPAAAEALVTAVWTNASALTGTPHATYVGFEGGVMLLGVRLSAGVSHRVAGPAGPSPTLVTGSIGLQTAW